MPRPKWLHGASSRSIFSPSPIDRTKPRAGVLFSRLPIPLSTRLVCTCSTSYPVTCMLHTATIPLISTLLIKITSTSSRPPILKSWTFLVCRRIRCETSNITIWQCGQGVLTSSFFSSFLFERTRPAASMRPPCLMYLYTSTGVRTECHYLISLGLHT